MSRHPARATRPSLPSLFLLLLLVASCAAVGRAPEPTPHDPGPEAVASATPDATDGFAAERALGAECDRRWVSEPPFQDSGCYGLLPAHVAEFLRNLPGTHPYLDAHYREEQARKKQLFRFVEGYGARPDVLARIDRRSEFWIRSFEGERPDVTVYVVYGPACEDQPGFRERFVGDGCLPGHPYVTRDIRIYRVQAGGVPEDVTIELAPPPPELTAAESARYGIHLRPPEEGAAWNTDIGLDVTRLAVSPVMRWTIAPAEEGDYEKPRIPDDDPRGFSGQAHFGFLVWTGERFDLREKIPLSLWACGVSEGVKDNACLLPYAGGFDPYLIENDDQTPSDGES